MKNVNFISDELRLDGNHLCLNFINTIFDRHASEIRDLITSREDWVAWLKKVNLIDKDFEDFKETKFELSNIVETRELFYRLFKAIQLKKVVLKKDLKQFEALLLKKQRSIKLSVLNGKPFQETVLNDKNLNDYLLPIIQTAYELFMSDKINRIKMCNHCGWLYLDISKNNSRKWCSMDTCGSQLKAKRYYRNKKAKATFED
ncbi:CGNR zinc finger domain-containing protein [Pontimicrobium sp. SW4]|uniref:CGNR zinc finger domain-containing protein n=1 Tax=Pontimicrobium sp. SW4 TaxID=3153519 RepID=A0AAU7BTV3_9FLAO